MVLKTIKKLFITILLILLSFPCYATDYSDDAAVKGAWLMTVDSDDETDISANGETLTETSGTIPTSVDVPTGYSGTSRDMELTDSEYFSHVDGGSTDISGSNQAISMCIWVKPESLAAGAFVMSKYNSASQRSFLLRLADDGGGYRAKFDMDANGTGVDATGLSAEGVFTAGTWTHVCAVYNDTDIRMYINGALSGTEVAYTSGLHNSTAPFRIGTSGNDASFFDGLVTEAIIFNDALTPTEVEEIYDCGIQGTYCASEERVIIGKIIN